MDETKELSNYIIDNLDLHKAERNLKTIRKTLDWMIRAVKTE